MTTQVVRQRAWRPPIYARVDRDHPISKGIRAVHYPTGAGGVFDLDAGIKIPMLTNPTHGVGRFGRGHVHTAGTGAKLVIGTTHRLAIQPPTSLMWVGSSLGAPVNSSTLYGAIPNDTDATPWLCNVFTLSSTGPKAKFGWNSSNVNAEIAQSGTFTVGPHVLIGTISPAGTAFYDNGVGQGTGAGVTTITYAATACWSVNQWSTGRGTNTLNNLGALWSRVLTRGEISALSVDPFCFLTW